MNRIMKLSSRLFRTLAAATAFTLAACASTDLVNQWSNPAYTSPSFKKVMVIGVTKQSGLRRTFEDEFVAQLKAAEKQIADLKSQTVLADVNNIVAKSHELWGIGYIAHRADGVSGNDLRTLALEIRNRVQNTPSVVAVVGGSVDKPSVVIVTTQGARDRGLSAGDLVRVASETLGGRGGGKDDIAQGGGTDGARAEDALKAVEYAIGRILQSS